VNNVQSCRQLLALMREAQSPADFELYDALLRMANLRDQWTMALSLLNDMEKDGVRPTEAMLASTLHALIVANVRDNRTFFIFLCD
jgi:pentatricopeptide repeat protein